jgi:hypothetical protein
MVEYGSVSGVAGFAAAMDFSYSATDGFTSNVDNFVSVIISFASMAFGFIVLQYYFTDSAALVMDRIAAITANYSISVADDIDSAMTYLVCCVCLRYRQIGEL